MMRLLLVATLIVLAGSGTAGAAPLDEVFKAAAIDDLRDVRRLVSDGVVDPNATDARGDTLLIAAIRSDADRVAAFLVADPKVDVDRTNAALETALMIAAFRNKPVIAAALVARGAEVNRIGWTPLHYAASAGSVEIVRLLLDHSAVLDAASPNQTTPLMMAARSDHVDVCHLLIDAGADPTPINQRDVTAADFASRANDADLAIWLGQRADAWRTKYGPPAPK